MKYLTKIYPFLFSALFVMIPLTEHLKAIPNILLGVLLVLFPFVVKKHNWYKLKDYTLYSFLALIFIITIGIFIYSRYEDFSFLTRLFIVPVIILLSIPLGKNDFKKPLYAFLVGSGFVILMSSINLISHYMTNQSLKLDVGRKVNELLLGERPFLGFIYLTSFVLCLFLCRTEKNKLLQRFFLVCSLIFSFFILFISARLSLLSLVIVLFSSLFYTKNVKRTLLVFLGATVAIVLLISFNPNFQKRFTAGFEQEEFSVQKLFVLEPRSHIWNCSFEIAENESVPILGYGFRRTTDKLVDCYGTRKEFINEEHRNYFLVTKFNTHNQFVNFYLSAGLISLVFFIAFFTLLFKDNYSNYTSFALVLSLFLFCCVENVLSRQIGAMLFGSVFTFLILIRTKKKT